MSTYALKALASLDLNYYVACMYSCSLTLAVKLGFCNMQFTRAVLPPNCSRCDLSMTKIQIFSGGTCPQTPLLGRASRATTLASVSLHTRVLHPASRPPHFKTAGAGPGSGRNAWFCCQLTVHVYSSGYSALSAIYQRSYRTPLLRILRTGLPIYMYAITEKVV